MQNSPNARTGDVAVPATRDRSLALLALAALVALGAFAALLARVAPPSAPEIGAGAHVMPVPLAIPDFALVDHRGAPFDRSRLEGRWSLLFFGYASCPDVCPGTLATLARARETEGLDPRTQIFFVSVDPGRDSPERLAAYAAFFHPELIGVTGQRRELERLTRAVGAFHQRADTGGTEGAGYLVDHSASLFLVGPDARLHAVLDDPGEARAFAELVAAVQALERRS